LLESLHDAPLQRQALILPASAGPARRILRAVAGVRPLAGKDLVAITGDSININNVYRDADIVWNSRAIPIPLVFFAHQNPVAWDANGEAAGQNPSADNAVQSNVFAPLLPPTGTDEVLLHRDLMRVLLESAFVKQEANRMRLLSNADELAVRLRGRQPAFFDAAGDRRGGGEYVVAVKPEFSGGGTILAETVLEIWTRDSVSPNPVAGGWRRIQRLVIEHGRRFGN
jgi:hypothetical protein